jgi:hypothetical protein
VDRPKPAANVKYLNGQLVEFGSLDDGKEELTIFQKMETYLCICTEI